ncbi:copper chaperone PCu(A)C [Lysobacter brunescens]|uniref:Copper chaperone PCu(A)C n=1 Tax=Lysobacter brunescens TaxID=262323 RepID=A0ABW2Y8E8_9GAMM
MIRLQGRMAAAAVALGVVLFSACVPAGAQRVGDLRIEDPWVRATPPGAGVTGGFMTVRNTGAKDDRLVSVTSAAVARVEIHEMRHEDGMMRMRRIDAGLPVKAGAKIELAPGGYHLMLFGPKQPFVEGDVVVATARFEKAGNVEIAFRVRGLGAKREAGHHGH